MKFFGTPQTQAAEQVLNDLIKAEEMPKPMIMSRWKRADIVAVRARLARELRKMGFSYTTIGHVMQRDHTTIMHHCRGM